MTTPCEKTEVIDIIRQDLKEVKSDIKILLKFKNQFMAIALTISTMVTVIANVLVFLIKK